MLKYLVSKNEEKNCLKYDKVNKNHDQRKVGIY